jgi:hypothetical protein
MRSDIVRLDSIDVMYVREYEKPSEEAFAELEAVVGLKGRRFYGLFDEDAGKYWACVQRREQDAPARLGLRTGTIEGGLYAFERLRGDYQVLITLIAPTFEAMSARHSVDLSRPAIEFYRRHDEFVLYLPIAESEAG